MMPAARRALERTRRPVGAFATSSAATLPTPAHSSVPAAKSIRARVIATPRVPSNIRWQSCSRTSSRSKLALLTTSMARSAAVAASGPWPRPSTNPNSAASPPRSTAIPRSPDVYSVGSGRPARAHSIGPLRPLSFTGRNPLPHFDRRAAADFGFHDQSVHEAAGPGQAQSQPATGRVPVLQRPFDVGDAGALVLGAYHQGPAAVPLGHH